MRGATLVQAVVRCGKAGCRCPKGGGHRTRFLTFKWKGKTVSVYVPKDRLAEVKGWVREHKRIKALVREISELTMELMRAEERALKRRR